MILNKLEGWHNWASDTNYVWFPFLWLKPKPEEKITFKNILVMTLLFGPYFSLYNYLKLLLFQQHPTLESFEINILKFTIFFFIWFNLVTAFFWNRRARRLSAVASSQAL